MTLKQIDENEIENYFRNCAADGPKLGYRPEPYERMLATFRRVQAERTVVAPKSEELFSASGRSGDAEKAAVESYGEASQHNPEVGDPFYHQTPYEAGFLDGVQWLMEKLGQNEQ